MDAHPGIARGKWAPEEDARLRAAVALLGVAQWAVVAATVGTRTRAQCLHRWRSTLSPAIVRSKWTSAEDARLVAAVARHGWRWTHVAVDMPGRSSAQCRERYCNKLDPAVSVDTWTPAQDEALLRAVETHGAAWKRVVDELVPRRARYAARKHWAVLMRRRARADGCDGSATEDVRGGCDEGATEDSCAGLQ